MEQEIKPIEKTIVCRIEIKEELSTEDDRFIRGYMIDEIKDAMCPKPRYEDCFDNPVHYQMQMIQWVEERDKLDIHPTFKTTYTEDAEYLEASLTYATFEIEAIKWIKSS